MLTKEILQALKSYAETMQKNVTFVVQTGEHSKRDELVKFLSDIASVSEKLNVEEDFFENTYKERVSKPGPIDFYALLVNDSYKGLD